jgi:Holliday junction resolvase
MGKPSRDKGKRGEREFAGELRHKGYDAHRGQQYHGGADSPDVVGLPGIHIEVKRTEKLRLWDAVAQAVRDAAKKMLMPIVAHRKNGKPWVVILLLDDFLRLYRMSGMGEPEEGRKTYGELLTENCKLRDEVTALRAKLEADDG